MKERGQGAGVRVEGKDYGLRVVIRTSGGTGF